MGGTSSQPVPNEMEQDSVFSLSQELQEQMIKDYNNEQVLKLFGKQMEKIAERKSEIIQESLEQRTKLKQHIESFREQNKQIHQQLDESIERFEDKFTDAANVVEYDSSRLEKKHLSGKGLIASRKDIPCFDERSNMAACYHSSNNKVYPQACDLVIEALTECVNKTITKQ